jgi:hypothetical protein
MVAQRRKPILIAVISVALVWVLACTGYIVANHYKVTPEKLAAYLRSHDLKNLSGSERDKALRDLARQLNSLSAEDRRKARMDREWNIWFQDMTESEKGRFIEETMPSGFKQMLTAFEQLPEEKRRKAVNDALRNMRKTRDAADADADAPDAKNTGPNRMGELSPDLQKKVVQIGLKSFYSDSSAQTKAELAPVMEEIQNLMENGKLFRNQQ